MPRKPPKPDGGFPRLGRPLTLGAQVEQLLRQAIASGQFADGRLPTEVELAEQLGVSRETVRLAAEVLQREGLLHKVRRRGTYVRLESLPTSLRPAPSQILGYIQASYDQRDGGALRHTSAAMLQGAVEAAGKRGFRLLVQEADATKPLESFRLIHRATPLAGVVFASFGEEKQLKKATAFGIPVVLVDHDAPLPKIDSIRDDSFDAARLAVHRLADLGHRRIAFAAWRQVHLNPWRLGGYRQGMRERRLPQRRQWEIAATLDEPGAKHFVRTWLDLRPRPTAAYCFNNTIARLIVAELRREAIDCPGELSVFGGGGEETAELTCHQADWPAIGARGIEMLLKAIEEGERHQPEHAVVGHRFREGMTADAIGP
ncbi:MAG: GntR family transcriptional regulator [Gemmataceae bacterium]|nr:GntR family transcriptional regulator [Gemmataceae bacterium]